MASPNQMPQFNAGDGGKAEADLKAYVAELDKKKKEEAASTQTNGTMGRVRSTVCGSGTDSMTHWTGGPANPEGLGLHFAGVEGSVATGPGKSMGFVSDGTLSGTKMTSTVQKEIGKGGWIHFGVVVARKGKTAEDVVGGPSVTGQVGYVGGAANDSGFSVGGSFPPGLAGGASNTVILP